MSGPTVVEFKREGWRDTIATLKGLIERMESGEQPEVTIGVMVLYDVTGGLATFGFGPQSEDLQLIAMLELGKTQLLDAVLS